MENLECSLKVGRIMNLFKSKFYLWTYLFTRL